MIRIGDEIEWDYVDGTERGRVIGLVSGWVEVEYDPWCDTTWLPINLVRKWNVIRINR